jgi:hypothetical protein
MTLVVYPLSSFDCPVALRENRRGGRESRETKDTEKKLEEEEEC